MQLKLFHKLFLILLVACLGSIVLFALIVGLSFERSFISYINDVQAVQLERVGQVAAGYYSRERKWERLIDNRRLWRRILREAGRPPSDEPRIDPSRHDPSGPDPSGLGPPRKDQARTGELSAPPFLEGRPRRGPPGRAFRPRPTIYDLEKRIVVGRMPFQGDALIAPIQLDGEQIGWVGAPRLEQPRMTRDISFFERQRYLIAAASGGALLLAVLIALLSARRLATPIKRLSDSVRALAGGDFERSFEVSSRDEIGQLGDDFNALARSLRDNRDARRRWVADVSHELRTPLSIVRAEVDSVRDGIRPLDERLLDSVDEEVQRLEKLVHDLYQLALAEVGSQSYAFERWDMREVLSQACARSQQRLDEAGLTLEMTNAPAKSPLNVLVDRERMLQLLQNLFENCLRYVPAPGVVRVSVEAVSSTQVALVVEDSGPGMTESFRERAFEPLERGDASRNRDSGGAGLGLAICKRIAEGHGGEIHAERSQLGGLLVRVLLPMAKTSSQ